MLKGHRAHSWKTDQKFSKRKNLQEMSLPPGNAVMHLQSDSIRNIISGKYQMQGLGRYTYTLTEIIPSSHLRSVFHHYLI